MDRIKRTAAAIVVFSGMLCLAACADKASVSDSSAAEESPAVAGEVTVYSSEEELAEESGGTIDSALDLEPAAFTMLFAGDVYLQDNITAAYDADGLSGILSEDLQEEFSAADLVMVNEEFPFGTGGEPAEDKQYTFRVDPSYVTILQEMGVDIVSLANNHVLDYGQDVLSQTFETLDAAEIAYVGAGESIERAKDWVSYEFGTTSVAVLCASRVIPVIDWDVRNSQPGVFTTYDETLLVEQIEAAKEENDLVVVYVHWGVEKSDEPEDYQRQLAESYIDAGADLVVGAHPHVLQGIEYYEGVPIVYSLGNFMFHETIDSTALLKVTVEDGELSLALVAAKASDSQTYALEGDAAQEVLSYIESISFDVQIGEDGTVSPAQ